MSEEDGVRPDWDQKSTDPLYGILLLTQDKDFSGDEKPEKTIRLTFSKNQYGDSMVVGIWECSESEDVRAAAAVITGEQAALLTKWIPAPPGPSERG